MKVGFYPVNRITANPYGKKSTQPPVGPTQPQQSQPVREVRFGVNLSKIEQELFKRVKVDPTDVFCTRNYGMNLETFYRLVKEKEKELAKAYPGIYKEGSEGTLINAIMKVRDELKPTKTGGGESSIGSAYHATALDDIQVWGI